MADECSSKNSGILGKLKTLLNINIAVNEPLVSININSKSNNSALANKEFYHDPDAKKLDIFEENLSTAKKKSLADIIRSERDRGNEIFEDEAAFLLAKLRTYEKTKSDKQVLEFFKPLIPENDYEALKCALYLRHAFEKGESTQRLKEDIRFRFDVRGSNIANLCTAGYFESFLMPLYNASPKRFKELYDVSVKTAFPGVFVHTTKTANIISNEIVSKIKMCKKYGVPFLYVHGIGNTNIAKIKDFVGKNKHVHDFFEKTIFEDEGSGIILVELLLK